MARIRRFGRWLTRVFHATSADAIRYYTLRRQITQEKEAGDEAMQALVANEHELASKLSEPILEQFEKREHERRQSVEAKARTNLLSISLAVAIATALFGLVSAPASLGASTDPALSVQIGYAAIIFGCVYFIVGGFFAFQVLDVQQIYGVMPRSHLDSDEVERRAIRLFYLAQNQRVALIMTHALAVSFAAIRNGILVFTVGMVAIAMQLLG